MIIPIVIDGSAISAQFNLTQDRVESVCDNIAKTLAARYAQALEQEAAGVLHQTRRRYIENIRVVDSGRMQGTVMLDYSKDPLVRMIEEGASAFDIKKGLLSGPKVRIGKKGGRYTTVPFRWGVPTTTGNTSFFSGILPKKVYDVVKNKATTIPVSGGGSRSAGLNIKEIPSPFSNKATRSSIEDSSGKILFAAYTHKTSLFQGMVKNKDAATGQNTYGSFRRVSENSDSDAFIHPGIEQYNLIQRALNNFNQANEVSIALDQELIKLGF